MKRVAKGARRPKWAPVTAGVWGNASPAVAFTAGADPADGNGLVEVENDNRDH